MEVKDGDILVQAEMAAGGGGVGGVEFDEVLEKLPGLDGEDVDGEVAAFGGQELALGFDFVRKALDGAGELGGNGFGGRRVGDQFGETADVAGGVGDIVEEDVFQGLAALFVADIGNGEDGEGFAVDFQGGGPDAEVEGLGGAGRRVTV